MLESITSIGCDAYHFGNAIDIERDILARVPSDIVVMGNIDPVHVLRMSKPDEVREATLSLLSACAKYPNFVLSSGCDIPPLTPWENIDAFFAAYENFLGSNS
jgi:uroporphyrinogen decarboxylase